LSALTAAAIGGVAGFSIFLGLPVARLRGLSISLQGFLNALALGILVFLLWDILSHATAPVEASLAGVRAGHPAQFIALALVFVAGFGAGLLTLTYGNRRLVGRVKATGQASPRGLAMAIATGLGFHNLSEGLAIGQSAAGGAIAFAGVLVIGFALHNITEGFGIAAPMTLADTRPSWAFLGLAGLVGGGPTVIGTMIGLFATSAALSVLFLALAAGALIYVINEMFGVSRRLNSPPSLGWGLLTGFVVAYATDLFLTYLTF
jgi:zinc transporter, ZIP family